jgi:hypothetical protein
MLVTHRLVFPSLGNRLETAPELSWQRLDVVFLNDVGCAAEALDTEVVILLWCG